MDENAYSSLVNNHPLWDINSNNMEDYQKRMLEEQRELKDRLTKLNAALGKDGFREKVGDYQFKLMNEQSLGMKKYYLALTARLTDMGLLNGGAMPEK